MDHKSAPESALEGEPPAWPEKSWPDHAPVLLWRSDLEGRRDEFNDTWLRFTGRRLEEELGFGWLEGVHPEDREKLPALSECLRHLVPYEAEYRLRRHDGEYRWILERAVPVWEANSVRGFCGAGFDVNHRLQSRDARDTLLRMMTHELRTPLQAVKMQLELMRRATAGGGACTPEMIDRLETQIDRFGKLIDGVSQSGDGGGALQRHPLDLSKLLRGVVERRSHELDAASRPSRHHLSYRGPERAEVDADRGRLELAFGNLLDNSVKFSPRGGPVDVDLKSEDAMHRVTVRDRGVGIPKDQIPQVSRRFFRARNAPRHNFPGLGLGLAAARDIVEKHGGALSVASQVDQGTEVTVLLPRRRERSA